MQRLGTVTSLDVSAVAGHHAMPAALLFNVKLVRELNSFLELCFHDGQAPVQASYAV